MKALSFSLKGDYGRFRTPYTTTSALTYSTIHPIAAKGIIGAIMGIDYSEIFEYSKEMKIGIKVLNRVRKVTQSINLKPVEGGNNAPNFQSRIEFLRDVEYKIYVIDSDEKLEKIKNKIINRDFIFTPYLGCSEYMAIIKNPEIFEVEDILEEDIYVNSIFPKKLVKEFSGEDQIYLDRIPTKNTKIREYSNYEKIIFSIDDNIKASKDENIFRVDNKNIYFF